MSQLKKPRKFFPMALAMKRGWKIHHESFDVFPAMFDHRRVPVAEWSDSTCSRNTHLYDFLLRS
jgi:hypothetical protein